VLSAEIDLAFFRPSGRTKLKRSIQKDLRVKRGVTESLCKFATQLLLQWAGPR
jgi:hypothetical protein